MATRGAGGRVKLALVTVVLLASALALLAWTQTWVDAELTQNTIRQHLAVTGATAAPALTALALAGLALAGALTIAGVIIRIILGLLEMLLGISVFLAAFLAVTDPAAASAAAVTDATGIAGPESTVAAVSGTALTGWPFLALAAALVMVLAGIGIIVTARRWPGPTRRYQAVRLEPAGPADADAGTGADDGADADARGDAIGDWDELSRGEDPTR